MFLLRILTAKGWTATALSSLVLRSEIGTITIPSVSKLEAETVQSDGAQSIPFPADISGTLALAHGPWLIHLGPRERLEVLRFMAKMYFALSYRRKEAYVLREMVSCIMDLVVHSREEIRGAVASSASASRSAFGQADDEDGHRVGVRATDEITGNDSVIRLVVYICGIYGVKLDSYRFFDDVEDTSSKPTDGNVNGARSHFGWPELQIGLVREALAIAEGLPGKCHEIHSEPVS